MNTCFVCGKVGENVNTPLTVWRGGSGNVTVMTCDNREECLKRVKKEIE